MKGFISILALSMLVLLPGCRKKDKVTMPPALNTPGGENPHGMGMGGGARKESVVVVPEFQKGKYKGVRLSLMDLATKQETLLEVPLNTNFPIPGTGLAVRVENILSAFGMGDGVITSRSDTMANPAAQVVVSEGGQEVWKGWLFSLYPDTHAFGHAKYTLKLVTFLPAK